MTNKQVHQSSQFMLLAIAAVFAVVATLILVRGGTNATETRVQGASDTSAQEFLDQLNETVDDAGQADLRVIKDEAGR